MSDADAPLGDVEVRVLGALIEKAHTTPDSYPLSLNALTNACNQSSNRDPIMSLDESAVSTAAHALRGRALVRPIIHSGGRVTKYAQRMDEALGLVRRQVAVLCVLMLRGPQTIAELRTRTQRLHDFADLDEVESTLGGLAERDPPLVARLPRRTGQKEARYAHLLAGDVTHDAAGVLDDAPDDAPGHAERDLTGAAIRDVGPEDVTALRREVAELRQEVAALRGELAAFRTQFE